ncbi:serine hydrolase domain-containing protein [Streptomyces sp. NPDC004296]|uniref:serine hydrolase domain-containing protein n=1 Tax=Streptomyces sp. NPDC004296 TaxID=3364697 RepID=UPI003695AA5C
MSGATPPRDIKVVGDVSEQFEAVRDVFVRCLAALPEGGAAFAVYASGRKVVDLTGGSFSEDTLAQVFSVSKAVTAVAVAHAVEHGRLDVDVPLAQYWPEFHHAGRDAITPRMVLGHSAGLPAVTEPLTKEDLLTGGLEAAISRQEPIWEPGTAHGYGAFTFGALLDGAFSRQLDCTVAEYVAEHITGPAELDVWYGLPEDRKSRSVPTRFVPPVVTPAALAAHEAGIAIQDGSFAAVVADPAAFFRDPDVQRAQWPAMSVVATARSLAKLAAQTVGTVDGVRLLHDKGLAHLVTPTSVGWDRVLLQRTKWAGGVELARPQLPLLGRESFGHPGAGGSVLAADPCRNVGAAFTTDTAMPDLGASEWATVLLTAVDRCLDDA